MIKICPDMASFIAQKIRRDHLSIMNDSIQVILEEDVKLHETLGDLPNWYVISSDNVVTLFLALKNTYDPNE